MEFGDQEVHEVDIEHKMSNSGGTDASPSLSPSLSPTPAAARRATRFGECRKNHALAVGGHALDGCGEFLPAGGEGTLEALKCAACSCHRNFHFQETGEPKGRSHGYNHGRQHYGHGHTQQFITPYFRQPAGLLHLRPATVGPLALPSTSTPGGVMTPQSRVEEVEDEEAAGAEVMGSGLGSGSGSSSKKRFRTKFSNEQKEKMLQLAESLGWRIQKHDAAVVQQFCQETGVQPQVLKVWMHNNKHTLGKKP